MMQPGWEITRTMGAIKPWEHPAGQRCSKPFTQINQLSPSINIIIIPCISIFIINHHNHHHHHQSINIIIIASSSSSAASSQELPLELYHQSWRDLELTKLNSWWWWRWIGWWWTYQWWWGQRWQCQEWNVPIFCAAPPARPSRQSKATWVLASIVTDTKTKCEPTLPQFLTQTAQFLDWSEVRQIWAQSFTQFQNFNRNHTMLINITLLQAGLSWGRWPLSEQQSQCCTISLMFVFVFVLYCFCICIRGDGRYVCAMILSLIGKGDMDDAILSHWHCVLIHPWTGMQTYLYSIQCGVWITHAHSNCFCICVRVFSPFYSTTHFDQLCYLACWERGIRSN